MEKSAQKEFIALPKFSEDDLKVLRKYFEINERYREQLNVDLVDRLQPHPVFGPMMRSMPPEVLKARQDYSLELQRAAIFEGKWEQYAEDLIAQGRMYARMNITYADWYELIQLAKILIMPQIRHDFANNPQDGFDYIDGLNKFIDYAMYGIAEAYFQEKNEIIRGNEEQLSLIFNNSIDHIALVDREGIILNINRGLLYKREELVGRNIVDFQGPENVPLMRKAIQNAVNRKESAVLDTEITYKGSPRFYRSSISPAVSESGEVTGAIIISRDITAQKEAELELSHLNTQLENKVMERTEELNIINKELESFTYSVSHDLRSPLRAINGFSEILKMELGENVDEDVNDALREILKNTKRMGRLIDNLLEFSRLGKQHVSRADVDMEEIVKSIIDDIRDSSDRRIDFVVGKLHHTNGDLTMLRQVMINLISNAVKYSSKNPEPRIEISSVENDGDIIYSIKDNGAGFNMKYYDKLFGIFQRLHGSDEFEGIGVGLAIVQRVVMRHHGRVWAEGKEGEGATFYVSLPMNMDSNL
jgi:PAS domain S-box-containing protein